jgi:hypothetical protein
MGPVFFFSIPPPSAPPRNSAPPAPCSCAPWLLWGGEERAGRRGGVYVRARARARSPPARVGGPTGSGEWRSAPPRPPAALISLSFFSSLAPPRARGAKEKKERAGGPPARARATPEPCARGHPANHHGLSRRCPAHHPHPRRTVRGDGAGLLVSARRRAHLFAAAGRGGGRRPARPAARVVPPSGSRPGGGCGRLFGRARCEGN